MALQKQVVPVILNQGLDTKTDEKLVVPGKLLECENALMQQNGAIKLRTGYNKQKATVSDISFAANTPNALLIAAGQNIYSHGEATDKDLGEFIPFSVEQEVVTSSIRAQQNCDIDFNDSFEVSVCEDSSGYVTFSIFDRVVGSYTYKDVSLDTGTLPRVGVSGTVAIILYVKSSELLVKFVNLLDGTTISSGTISGTGNFDATANKYDVVVINSQFVIAHTIKTSNYVKVTAANSRGEIGSGLNGMPGAVTITTASTSLTLAVTSSVVGSETFALFYSTSAPYLYYTRYSLFFLPLASATSIVALNATAMGAVYSATDDLIYLHTQASATNSIYSVTLAGVATVESTNILNMGVYTKPFILNGVPCFVNYYKSDDGFQDSAVFVSKTNKPFALINNIVYPSTTPGILQNGNTIIAGTVKTRALSEDGVSLFYQTSMSKLTVEQVQPQAKSSGGLTLISGGFLKQYDGSVVTEAQFLFSPEKPTTTGTTGGSVADGTYSYITTWEWTDNNGNRMQSLSSVPKQHVKSTSGNASIIVSCKKLPSTLIPTNSINFPMFCVYRTTNGGTVYYKVSSDTSPVSANPNTSTVTFTDTLADASIISREVLYTTGGILDNSNPGRVDAICFAKQRAFFAGLSKPEEIKYSKLVRSGFSISANDNLVIRNRVPKELGNITAIEELDDKVVLFYERGIYVIVGDGPTDAGQGGQFSDPQYISSDVGCSDSRSLIRSQLGLMFKSEKGIWLLDRSLSLSYIGAEVEKFNDEVVTGAAVIPNNNQIRFSTESGIVLSYDYYWKQWYTATEFPSIGSFVRGEKHHIISSDHLWIANDEYTDNSRPVTFKIATSWLSLSGLAGFQRMYRLQVLGNTKDPCLLKVSFFYDFREYAEEVMYWDSTTDTVYFGEEDFGEGFFGGSNDGVFRAEFRPARQKCSSVKMVIENVPTSTTELQGFELSSLSLQVGMKPGFGKMSKSKYGSTR
jgi:hypothetical protein